MNNYEGMFILRPTLEADSVDKSVSSITDLITKKGGIIEKTEKLGKRALNYVIKKNKEGEYVLTCFKAEPSIITPIKEAFKLDDDILKLMIIRK